MGVLDDSGEIVRGSGPPQSTDPGESFTIDSGGGVAEEGDTELQKLLRVSETTIFSDVTTGTGRVLSLHQKSLLPAGPGTEEFLITLNQESWEFNPVFQLSFGSLVTQIHAVTGVTVLAQNLSAHHATECR